MDKNDRHPFETAETARQRVDQVRALREQVRTGGLKFEAYLTPDLALWVLDMVEKGLFIDPSEAVFILVQEAKELAPHEDLRRELLGRSLDEARKGPYSTAEEVMERLERRRAEITPPARWVKINNSELPED